MKKTITLAATLALLAAPCFAADDWNTRNRQNSGSQVVVTPGYIRNPDGTRTVIKSDGTVTHPNGTHSHIQPDGVIRNPDGTRSRFVPASQ